MHRHSLGGALVLCFAVAAKAGASPPNFTDSVARVQCAEPSGSGFGSGVAVAVDGNRVYVLTNAHNFRDFVRERDSCTCYFPSHAPVSIDQLHYVGNPDAGDDVAVISGLAANPPPAVPLLDSDLTPGAAVNLIGYPYGREMRVLNAQLRHSSYNQGHLEFSETIPQGMSGGPVYHAGKVAGLMHSSLVRERGCLAVPMSRIRNALRRVFPRLSQRRDAREAQSVYGQCDSFGNCSNAQPVYRGQIIQSPIPRGGRTVNPAGGSIPSAGPIRGDRSPMATPSLPAASIPAKQPDLSGYVTRDELEQFVKRDELEKIVTNLAPVDSLSGYATTHDLMATKNAIAAANTNLDSLQGSIASRLDQFTTKLTTAEASIESVDKKASGRFSWVEAATRISAAYGLNLAVPGGAFGMIGLSALKAYWNRRRRRDLDPEEEPRRRPFDDWHPASDPPPPPAPPPPPPRETPSAVSAEPAVRTVRVPVVDQEAEAMKEAMRREQERFPQHSPIIKRLRSVTEQITAGKRAAGEVPAEKPLTVGWTDENQQA